MKEGMKKAKHSGRNRIDGKKQNRQKEAESKGRSRIDRKKPNRQEEAESTGKSRIDGKEQNRRERIGWAKPKLRKNASGEGSVEMMRQTSTMTIGKDGKCR
jgi:hypothetical protein